ncbi:hypothetical protein N7457_008308 [Penicillium paradoxum]|uniref:uncharacterized protein n=1 Tax=Penicillium paradoxum TaxID=176176 RepID=UPI0025470F1A|nr:uncharacterized protein N7457_008308 [Penicillium paradoxum]KAJ5773412.1 hypothetical protein N7457_008308 [Penicillium paradoxum]
MAHHEQGYRSMVVLPIHGIIIAILLLLAHRSAAQDVSSNVSNSLLYDMVPDCAKDCVVNFIKSEYTPTQCKSPSNIKCLCRTQSSGGLTLGEAALSCVLSVCPQTVVAKSRAYHICDSVPEALPNTHQTITATVFSDTRTTITTEASTTAEIISTTSISTTEYTPDAPLTTSTTVSTLVPTSTTSSQTSEVTFYHASSSEPSKSQTETITSTSESALPPSGSPEDTNKKDNHAISPAAVIGVSVASGIAGSFIIVVAVLFCRKRWRRRHPESARLHVFEIGGAMSEPSDFSKPMPRLPTGGSGLGSSYSLASGHEEITQQQRIIQPMADVRSPSRYLPRFARTSHPGQSRDHERIGFAISSDSDWEASPRTDSSQHSMARLIPDGPAGMYPKPLNWNHRPDSGGTLFEEDETHQAVAAAGMTQNNSPRLGIQPRLAGLPPNPRAFKDGFPTGNFKRRSGPPSTLASPFNPNSALKTSSSNNSAAINAPPGSCSSLYPNTHLAAPTHTTPDQHRSLSPGTHAPHLARTPSSSIPPGSEIVSRPRIVHGNDIKRVQIRNSPRPPSEVVAPYCPEDLWLERGRAGAPPRSREVSGELPYPSELCPGVVHYPDSPKRKAVSMANRVSPTSRNLTPSRRGDDLILRVD